MYAGIVLSHRRLCDSRDRRAGLGERVQNGQHAVLGGDQPEGVETPEGEKDQEEFGGGQIHVGIGDDGDGGWD